jgi:hypothetical protein
MVEVVFMEWGFVYSAGTHLTIDSRLRTQDLNMGVSPVGRNRGRAIHSYACKAVGAACAEAPAAACIRYCR